MQPKQPPQPVQPIPEIMVPANFRHPKANRESRLGNALIAYEFRRSKRRTIGFSVGSEGLVVSAPKWVALHAVESALLERTDWIIKKLGETQQRRAQLESARIEWSDGTQIPFLGQPVIVVLDPRHAFGTGFAQLQENCNPESLTLPGVVQRALHFAAVEDFAHRQRAEHVGAFRLGGEEAVFEVVEGDVFAGDGEGFHFANRQVVDVTNDVQCHDACLWLEVSRV